jgi:glycosyltransferase involved in cell wall biosynthesis
MSSPYVSVIMSVYNSDGSLRKSIQSILNQSYKNYEFIIVNDGSTDDSYKIINDIKKKNSRIKFYNFKENKGLGRSLNFAIKRSKGSYIARLDSDDYAYKDRLSTQIKFIKRNPLVDILGSNADYFSSSNKFIKKTKMPISDQSIKNNIYCFNPLIHSSLMIKKSFFKNNYYNEGFYRCQDYELWLRSYKNFNFFNLKKVLIKRLEKKNVKIIDIKYSILARVYHLNLINFYKIFIYILYDVIKFLFLFIKNFLVKA